MHKGRNALITGGSSGIGKEMVFLFAKEGANVIFTGSREEEQVKNIIDEASKFGTEITYIRADFKNKDEVEQVGQKALEKYKVIDILINNAATVTSNYVLNEKIENLEMIMQVNVYAPFQLIKILCPKMVENKWGRVINISSVAGFNFEPGLMTYGLSKLAIIPITKTLASELGTTGVTANIIVPGIVDTPMVQYGLEMVQQQTGQEKEVVLEKFLGRSKVRELIDPKDVAALASFLASNQAKHITGSEHKIDGGHMI